MIATFTDFGISGPYLGQVRAALAELAPDVPVVDVFPDLPPFDVQSSAYLLPAYSQFLPEASVCLCVVDPGVGGSRKALALQADSRWYVGPDNGLLSKIAIRASDVKVFEISWRPQRLSNSFHGRDLFAPVCAMIASGQGLPEHLEISVSDVGNDWPDDLWQVVYIDNYGNCVTGVRGKSLDEAAALSIGGAECRRQRTFSDSEPGTLFWYENSNGLVEIALSQGNAAKQHGMVIGAQLVVSGN